MLFIHKYAFNANVCTRDFADVQLDSATKAKFYEAE